MTATGKRVYAPRVPASQRRSDLLDAALQLIAGSGYKAVTMEAVAEHAGVSKPVVYGQFTNRAALLTELLVREQELAVRQLLAIMPTAPGALRDSGPARAATRLLSDYLDVVRAAPERWYCIVMPLPDMPPEFHEARDHSRTLVLSRATTLADHLCAALGHPPGLDPEILAHTGVALFENAARLMLTDPVRFHPTRFVTTFTALLAP